jgi:hypothetical protein
MWQADDHSHRDLRLAGDRQDDPCGSFGRAWNEGLRTYVLLLVRRARDATEVLGRRERSPSRSGRNQTGAGAPNRSQRTPARARQLVTTRDNLRACRAPWKARRSPYSPGSRASMVLQIPYHGFDSRPRLSRGTAPDLRRHGPGRFAFGRTAGPLASNLPTSGCTAVGQQPPEGVRCLPLLLVVGVGVHVVGHADPGVTESLAHRLRRGCRRPASAWPSRVWCRGA